MHARRNGTVIVTQFAGKDLRVLFVAAPDLILPVI